MQRTQAQTPAQRSAPTTQRPSNGPTVIDPRAFKLVAGGSPKGGWQAASGEEISSPKGGWY